ncbi:MAG: DUF4157 domain-containing protein [Candidatus Tectimicrobiota bacterium]
MRTQKQAQAPAPSQASRAPLRGSAVPCCIGPQARPHETPVPAPQRLAATVSGAPAPLTSAGSKRERQMTLSAALPRLQTKLMISQPGDRYEQEADRVAAYVTRLTTPQAQTQTSGRRLDPSASRQPLCTACAEALQRQPAVSPPFAQRLTGLQEPVSPFPASGGRFFALRSAVEASPRPMVADGTPDAAPEKVSGRSASASISAAIHASRGKGQPLPTATRSMFEHHMGYRLDHVSIHTDSTAATLAAQLQAMAFTVGSDVYFGQGQFNLSSLTGRYLLAHELAHVVQQTGSPRQEALRQAGSASAWPAGLTPGMMVLNRQHADETIQCGFPWLIAAAVLALAAVGYAWWAHNCLAPVEIPMYMATFGSDYMSARSGGFRLWYFNQTRQPLASRLWDAFGHCYVACAATRRCGATTAAIAGRGREFYREYIDAAPHDSYTQDVNNQALGRSFGSANRDCEQACRAAALNGTLDLTAPLVTFWTPTRGEYVATAAERRTDQARLAEEARQRDQRALEARLRAAYGRCLSRELERPGGIPSAAEEEAARETCRRETGYPH